MDDERLNRVRWVGRWEAVSFIVLLGIAMPLKYWMDMPLAVRIVGMAHGLLFIAYCYAVWDASDSHGWDWRKSALFYGASFVPFGPFLVESRLVGESAAPEELAAEEGLETGGQEARGAEESEDP
jgi:integral membrane protein